MYKLWIVLFELLEDDDSEIRQQASSSLEKLWDHQKVPCWGLNTDLIFYSFHNKYNYRKYRNG